MDEQVTQETPEAPPEKSFRWKRRQERIARVKAASAIPRVRVIPRDDEMRGALRHPSGIAFLEEGSIEWPLDNFTRRRIAEGVVSIENPEPQPAPAQ